MAERVGVAERAGGLDERLDALQPPEPERLDVVDEVLGEQLVQPVELAGVDEMAVQRDQLLDRQPIVRGQRHRPAG
jgi:hypothetical protein